MTTNTIKRTLKSSALILASLATLVACESPKEPELALNSDQQISAINQTLIDGSPWATTAIYLQVNDKPDTSINYIDDKAISKGTISSAQYSKGQFLFIGMADYTTGDFDETSLTSNLNATTDNGSAPKGFAFGNYQIVLNDQENAVRRITNASFAPSAVIDRTVTEANSDKFTYTFTKNGKTYYVEHKNYQTAFPEQRYPAALQVAVEKFFTSH